MLAYEAYQYLKAGRGSGKLGWPLLERLWAGDWYDNDPRSRYIVLHDEETLPEMFKRPMQPLIRPDQ